jgi:hypothetical protein
LAQLDKAYANSQSDIANQAPDAENSFNSNVDNTKTNLYTMNANAADPLTTAAQAQASAGAIVAPQSYPTLSNVFGDALSPFATANKTNSQSMTPGHGIKFLRRHRRAGKGARSILRIDTCPKKLANPLFRLRRPSKSTATKML